MLRSALPACSRHQEGMHPTKRHVDRRYQHLLKAGVLVAPAVPVQLMAACRRMPTAWAAQL